jgi:hypothetical protein
MAINAYGNNYPRPFPSNRDLQSMLNKQLTSSKKDVGEQESLILVIVGSNIE